jgi:DNA-binding NarL/FixJ family response regulator
MSMITLLLADDHPVFRTGLGLILRADPSISIVGEAATGEEARSLIDSLRPDVALLDIEMPVMSGLDVVRWAIEYDMPTRIVMLTMYADEEIFNEALDLGVTGYVLKENAATDIINSVHSAAAGQYYISPTISGYLVSRSQRKQQAIAALPALASLTPTEWKILKLIAGNRTTKEIAADLHVSPKTIENHRANIAQKLSLRGTNAVLRFALEKKAFL